MSSGSINTSTAAAAPPRPRLGGAAWGSLRNAVRTNAIPGLEKSNEERAKKLNFAEAVWKAKWQEEQRIRAAEAPKRRMTHAFRAFEGLLAA